jgi:hypothetical protein
MPGRREPTVPSGSFCERCGYEKTRTKGNTKKRVRDYPRRRRLPGVPPADSVIWPEPFRGERWKPVYGLLFRGKCQLCAYAFEQPKSRQILDRLHRQSRLMLCTNHPQNQGELTEVLPTGTCRNFSVKPWHNFKHRQAKNQSNPLCDESDPSVRRIPLGNGLFTIVDAEDYDMLSKYKWMARRTGGVTFYAYCRIQGKPVSMHRMIMHPRKGYVVDHIDGNGLNNRRCNLRECTQEQNRANARPRGGVSGFVGVYPSGDKWVAGIIYRGKHLHLGRFADPVEAAKARDRKAYELLGEYAYLNHPQDLRKEREGGG